jgi:hypothetical protein
MVLPVPRLLVYVIHILSPFVIIRVLSPGHLEVFLPYDFVFFSYLVQVET